MQNSIIIIDPSSVPRNGDFVIIAQQSMNTVMLNEIYFEDGMQFIISLREHSHPKKLEPSEKIIGVVAETINHYLDK